MNLKFVKLANCWFVHLPNYEGSPGDLEMVLGADVLCDLLDRDEDGIINTVISTEENDNPFNTYVIDFVNSTLDSTGEQDGANYRLREWKLDLWLCNVTKYVFGEFPSTIYIQIL